MEADVKKKRKKKEPDSDNTAGTAYAQQQQEPDTTTAANRLVSASAKEFDETPQRRPLAPVHYQPAEQFTGQAVARGSVPKPTLELSHREAASDEALALTT